MDYKLTAQKIIDSVGGSKNIHSADHCMTRLRFVLNDESIPNDAEIENIPGVMGVMRSGGQYQIVIGNNVSKCYDELKKMLPSDGGSEKAVKHKKGPISTALDFISGCMTPIIPAIIAGGLVKVILVLLGESVLDVVNAEDQLYIILSALGDAPFYFIPFLLAYTASKKLNCSTALTITIAGFLLYPSLITLLSSGEQVYFLGIPVRSATYSSSVIPILLSAILLKYVEKLVDKITPEWSKNFLKPLLILIITAPLALVVIGPIGAIIGDLLSYVLNTIYNFAPWLAMTVFAGLMPFIVMTGMHYAFYPTAIAALASPGYELLLMPAMLSSNLAQAAASTGVAIKTKDGKMRQVAFPAAISAFFAGVTEPAMYGVTLRLKTPMIAACIGSAAGGFFCGLTGTASYGAATPCITSIIQFISPENGRNFVNACIVAGISMVISFVLTLILYKNPPVKEDRINRSNEAVETSGTKSIPVSEALTVSNPVRGTIVSLESVKDETFATGILGKGYAVIPDGDMGRIVAPFDGIVDTVSETNHAIGIVSDSGINLLIHVGIDTVSLNGKYFTPRTKDGERFKKGDTLLEFDISGLKSEGYDTTIPIIVTNADDFSVFKISNRKTADELFDMINLEYSDERKR